MTENSYEPQPSASTSSLGVIAILVGLAGSAAVGLNVSHLVEAYFLDEPMPVPSTEAIAFMAATVIGSVVIAFIRDCQTPIDDDQADAGRTRRWPHALGLMLVPTALAWVQFELFFEVVYMVPILSFFGAVLWTSRFSGLLPSSRFRRTLTFFLVMTVGVPLGVFVATVPTNHFKHHGTAVVWLSGAEYEEDEIYMEADDDESENYEFTSGVPSALLEAMATAEEITTVEVDGKTYRKHDDGRLELIVVATAADRERDIKAAVEKEEAERERTRAIKREALRKRNLERRNGGRLFSSP